MKNFISVAALTLFVSACVSQTMPQKSAVVDSSTVRSKELNVIADKDGRICTMETSIGSNIKKRVCRTQKEIDEAAQQTRETMNRGGLRVEN